MNRYRSDRRIRGGKVLATNAALSRIRASVRNGTLKTSQYVSKEDDRLDTIAARFLGDSRLWWVSSACSGIGWGLQIPPGTIIKIPVNIERISALI